QPAAAATQPVQPAYGYPQPTSAPPVSAPPLSAPPVSAAPAYGYPQPAPSAAYAPDPNFVLPPQGPQFLRS
ncbi:MAG TPA: TerD family protein, partial [Streptomyces sp.]